MLQLKTVTTKGISVEDIKAHIIQTCEPTT